MQTQLNFEQQTKVDSWTRIVSAMTTEQIQMRSLLVSMSEPTEENVLFQQLLKEEYNKRNNN